ncbi:hypothetical protein C8Q80DRAFT_1275102 [Daedaleopsis nitida]|nr:hypothetical protein C8Q80DRAFT_1275102 [Daedaleopsis nitida]
MYSDITDILLAIRKQLSTLSPINTLPTEILSMIFQLIIGQPLKDARPSDGAPWIPSRPLLTITHLLQQSLRRSQPAPLSIVLTQDQDDVENVESLLRLEDTNLHLRPISGWSQLMEEFLRLYGPRMRRLDVTLGWAQMVESFVRCFEHPADELEVFTIEFERHPILFGQRVSSSQGLGISMMALGRTYFRTLCGSYPPHQIFTTSTSRNTLERQHPILTAPIPFYLLAYLKLNDKVRVRFIGPHSRYLGNALWVDSIPPLSAIAAITQVELSTEEEFTSSPEPSVGLVAMLLTGSITRLRVSVEEPDTLGKIVALLPRLRELVVDVYYPSSSEPDTADDGPPALYSTLSGVDGLAPLCLELRELAVQGEEGYNFMNPRHLIDMAAARSGAGIGYLIPRVDLQLRCTYASDVDAGRIEVWPDPERLSAALSSLTTYGCEYNVELACGSREKPEPPHRFELHKLWDDAGVRKYWRLDDIVEEWPYYYGIY